MSQLFRGVALSVVAISAVFAAPASAIVYVVTLGGTTSENYLQTTDAAGTSQRQDFALGAAFTATLRIDTDLLPANNADTAAGEDFRFAAGSGFFTTLVTFAGGGLPAFGGTPTLNSIVGAYGAAGYLELDDQRLLQDDAAAYEIAGLFISGFNGLQPVAGGSFPDFSSAQNLSFVFTGFRLDNATGASSSGYASGLIDSVAVRTENVAAVPEPATWATMALGFGLVGAAARRRRSAARV